MHFYKYALALAAVGALFAGCGTSAGSSSAYTGAYGSNDSGPGGISQGDTTSGGTGNDASGGSDTGSTGATVNAAVVCEESKCPSEIAACKADAKCAAALNCQAACATSACTLTCPQASGPLSTALNTCGIQAGCSGTKPVSVCGNGTCDTGETEAGCPADCKTTTPPSTCVPYTAVQAILKNNCNGCHGHQFGSSCAQAANFGAIAQYVAADMMPPTGPLSASDKAVIAAWAKSGGKCTAADCGGTTPGAVCGNGTCESSETTANCPKDCPAASKCGNGVCDAGESSTSCAADCPAGPTAGNICDTTCGAQAPSGCYCDNQCSQYGDCCLADGTMPTKGNPNNACTGSTCADCNGGGGTTPPATVCGNGKCEAGETAANCAKDCATGPTTGNICDTTCGAQAPSGCYCDNQCAQYGDCCLADGSLPTKGNPNTACTGSTCADCNGGGGTTPPAAVCGNGKCDAGETTANCAKDCPATATCGNGKCDAGETATSCAADCATGTKTCTTYTDVQAIFQNSCNGCHGHKFGNGCSSASNYSSINSWVQSGSMPQGSKLSAADKAKIAAWAAAKNACTTAQCP